jgi:uncharacterized protein (DUF983 family)
MPKNLVHCQRCRTLLNTDLKESRVMRPGYMPLREIARLVDVVPSGYYIACPRCTRELRVSRKYTGERVQCKLCAAPFRLDYENAGLVRSAFFARCPHCSEELRAAQKYLGMNVACKHCGGAIRFLQT